MFPPLIVLSVLWSIFHPPETPDATSGTATLIVTAAGEPVWLPGDDELMLDPQNPWGVS